jgi:CHAD domain-containing protein
MKTKYRLQVGEPARRCVRRNARWLVMQASRACRQLRRRQPASQALHDFRVTLRRLRTWLAVGDNAAGVTRKSHKRLRRLARLSNAARDYEVQAAWLAEHATPSLEPEAPALVWLKSSLHRPSVQQCAAARRDLSRKWPKLARRLRRQLRGNSPRRSGGDCGEAVAADVARHARRLRQTLGHIKSVRDGASAHRARISTKRLRYLLEPFQDDFEPVRNVVKELVVLQDLLGEWRDRELILQVLARSAEQAASRTTRAWFESAVTANSPLPDVARLRGSHPALPGLVKLARIAAREEKQIFARVREQCLGSYVDGLIPRIRSCAKLLTGTK